MLFWCYDFDMLAYREVQVRGILNRVQGQDDWFGLSYNLNLYRGCEHQCIYCDTRSRCYQIDNFNTEVLIKINAISLLETELCRKQKIGMIGFGSMNDPYTNAEAHYQLTGQALELIAKYWFPVHIITKSDMVLKDLETLLKINRVKARVSFSITTADDSLAKMIEPGAPAPTRRLNAMKTLAEYGIETGVVMMPVLPFIEDTEENVLNIVESAAAYQADYIIPSFGMTVRTGQREYYYAKLDDYFPGIRLVYEKQFGDRYHCPVRNVKKLSSVFYDACERYGIRTYVTGYPPPNPSKQLSLYH